MVCDLCCFEDWEEKDLLINQSVNNEGVCKTALAKPGLLIMSKRSNVSVRVTS